MRRLMFAIACLLLSHALAAEGIREGRYARKAPNPQAPLGEAPSVSGRAPRTEGRRPLLRPRAPREERGRSEEDRLGDLVLPRGIAVITSGYGPRWGGMHNGIDWAAPAGTPVRAPAAGVVAFAGDRADYGRLVIIDHGNGLESWYGHCRRITVQAGVSVAAGQRIATVGSSGRATGPHLHFEIRSEGRQVDPLPYLRAFPGARTVVGA